MVFSQNYALSAGQAKLGEAWFWWTLKSEIVSEDNGGAAVVKVTLVDTSSAIFVIDNDVNLSANQREQVLNEPLIMKESEILKVQASSGQVDVIASILEINREDR